MAKHPTALVTSVVHGKPESGVGHSWVAAYRAVAPSAPPSATAASRDAQPSRVSRRCSGTWRSTSGSVGWALRTEGSSTGLLLLAEARGTGPDIRKQGPLAA